MCAELRSLKMRMKVRSSVPSLFSPALYSSLASYDTADGSTCGPS
jgi:hypothetical protein